MASLSDITVKRELRPCLVNGKKALFHTWEQYSVGGIKHLGGIIEDENGQVFRVCPSSIKFLDNKIEEYCFNDEPAADQEV